MQAVPGSEEIATRHPVGDTDNMGLEWLALLMRPRRIAHRVWQPCLKPEGKTTKMTAANGRFNGLTAGQVRDIYRNKDGKTIRQLAIHYGVPERTINEARLYQARRFNPGSRGRIALVNVVRANA